MQAAMTAMDELLAMAQTDNPLWFKGLDGGKEALNHDEYVKKFSPFTGTKPCGFITDATREIGSVFITSLELVETMMSPVSIVYCCLFSEKTSISSKLNFFGHFLFSHGNVSCQYLLKISWNLAKMKSYQYSFRWPLWILSNKITKFCCLQ